MLSKPITGNPENPATKILNLLSHVKLMELEEIQF